MKNSVPVVNSTSTPNSCTIYDIELVKKGVHQVFSVDENGDADYLQETYSMEAYYAYYYCKNCEETFDTERDDFGRIWHDKEETWKQVKEHFNDGSNN